MRTFQAAARVLVESHPQGFTAVEFKEHMRRCFHRRFYRICIWCGDAVGLRSSLDQSTPQELSIRFFYRQDGENLAFDANSYHACYPENREAMQDIKYNPDAIWFNNEKSCLSLDYYFWQFPDEDDDF
jgi:hypothetical protein